MDTKDIKALHEEFCDECRFSTRLSPQTIKGYESTFQLLNKIIPDITLGMLVPKMMNEFFKRLELRERIVGRDKVKKGIKISTVGTYRSKLNTFFDWLIRNRHLKKNPFNSILYPKIEYSDRKFLGKEQLKKIWLAVSHNIDWDNSFLQKRNLALIGCMLYFGLRRGELLQLQVLDFDLEKRELVVRGQTSKSRRDRCLPINSAVYKLLVDYLKARKERHVTTPYLFISNNRDGMLTFDGFKHFIAKVVKESGVKFHPHRFRHTFAVNLLLNGTNLVVLKELLGHTDIRMTAAYLRCLPASEKRKDLETLSSLESLI